MQQRVAVLFLTGGRSARVAMTADDYASLEANWLNGQQGINVSAMLRGAGYAVPLHLVEGMVLEPAAAE